MQIYNSCSRLQWVPCRFESENPCRISFPGKQVWGSSISSEDNVGLLKKEALHLVRDVGRQVPWIALNKIHNPFSFRNWRRGNLWAMGSLSSQLSNHKRMARPFPRAHELPGWRMGARVLILIQMQEPTIGLPENCMGELLKYLPWNQLAHRETEVTADQPNLNKHASSNSFTLRSPRPPLDLAKQTTSQFTILLIFFSEPEDHKKFLISSSIWRLVLLGIGTTREMCKGIENNTCLTIINLPAKERHLAFRPSSLALIESKSWLKWECLEVPKKIETPR